ncbi:MAG: NADH-quinone oxidoreductase subunit C, partial [Proteobacteria bacterium]|nr:NADH-quinone oxidoreductase subunit C [Pseudomonadota bacterium]
MSETAESLWEALSARFGVAITGHNLCCGELTIEVDAAVALDVFVALRDESGFEELMDVAGVDYSAYGLTEWAT